MIYSTSEGNEGVPGGESFQVLRFNALKKGTEQIQLEYKRTFEEGIEKSCILEVEVI